MITLTILHLIGRAIGFVIDIPFDILFFLV